MLNSIKNSKITYYHIWCVGIFYCFHCICSSWRRPSCLPKVCVPCLGTLGDATLLRPFWTDDTLPPVWGAKEGRARVHSRILCFMDPQPKQAPVNLQQSPLWFLPQWERRGTSCPLEAPPGALAIDGAGRIVSLPVA